MFCKDCKVFEKVCKAYGYCGLMKNRTACDIVGSDDPCLFLKDKQLLELLSKVVDSYNGK